MEANQAKKYAKELENIFYATLRAFHSKNHGKLKGLNITFPQLVVLRILETEPNEQMQSLAGKLGLGLPTTTGIVDRLANAGLAKRSQDPKDKRVVRVSMTAKGKDVLAKAMKQRQKEVASILVKMEEAEGREFLRLLRKFLHLAIDQSKKKGN